MSFPPREEPRASSVDRHRLVRLILNRKGMSKSYPTINEVPVENIRFLKVFAGDLVFFGEEVICPDRKP